MTKTLRHVLFGGLDHLPWTAEIGVLGLRLAAGLSLSLAHGFGKLPPSSDFVSGVEGMGFPLPVVFAWSAALSEFLGGLLVAAGLLTRPAAFFAACTMGVAFFIVHGDDPFAKREMALLYGTIMLMFCLSGAGRLSVDRLLRRV